MPVYRQSSRLRLPWWMKLVLGVGIPAGLILGTIYFLGWASSRRWERYAARLRAGGVPLTFVEIEEQRLQVPPPQNSARVIERLAAKLNNDLNVKHENRQVILVFGRSAPAVDFFKGIPRYAVEPTGSFVAQHRPLLQELEAIRDMPHGRFHINYRSDPYSTLLNHLSPVRTASKLVYVAVTVDLLEGNMDAAVDGALLQFRLAGTLHDEPFLISRLVQMAALDWGVKDVEHTLRVGEPADAQLAALMDAIEERKADGSIKWGFLGERAGFVALCERLATGTIAGSVVLQPGPVAQSVSWLPDVVIRENQMRGAEILTWLVEAADDPRQLVEAAARAERELPGLPATQILTRMLVISPSRAVALNQRCLARLRCARVALAAERFRLRTGDMPASIETLVPAYLDEVPKDPFDGAPLRFTNNDDGIVIYSVADDLVDDRGIVEAVKLDSKPKTMSVAEWRRRKTQGPDIGFRLLRPAHRGLILTDEPIPEAF